MARDGVAGGSVKNEDLRELERAVEKSPGDERAIQALEAARIRRGLGWHGEQLPPRVFPGEARGVYRVRATYTNDMEMQFVYVPGGDVECQCVFRDWPDRGDVRVIKGHGPCGGSGKRELASFYLGRFPVTWGEYLSMPAREFRPPDSWGGGTLDLSERFHDPVVNVSHAEALAFCAWAGTRHPSEVRLPSEAEWKWAALGPPVIMDWAKHEATPNERGSGLVPRRFPWGNEPPSAERCVWSESPRVGRDGRATESSTSAVRTERHIDDRGQIYTLRDWLADPTGLRIVAIPERPLGASWCGAHDMAGNVWEWNADRSALGGSFRTVLESGVPFTTGGHPIFDGSPMGWAPEARDDVGFRLAVSGAR